MPRPLGDPSLIVRSFPLGFVPFRALHISSHALSFPAPCWAGKWLCRGAGSHEREKKERARERRRSNKWTHGLLEVKCTSRRHRPQIRHYADSACHTEMLKRRSQKWEESRNIRGWVFPSYCTFPVQHGSSSSHCTGKWWKRCKCAQRTQLHAVDLSPRFKVYRLIFYVFVVFYKLTFKCNS